MLIMIHGFTEEEQRFMEGSTIEDDIQDSLHLLVDDWLSDHQQEFRDFLAEEAEQERENKWLNAWYKRSV